MRKEFVSKQNFLYLCKLYLFKIGKMSKYYKTLITSALSLLFFFCTTLYAQTSCVAKAPSQVAVGQSFRYSLTIDDTKGKVKNISFPGFKLLQGPSQSTSSNISIVNGQMSRSETVTYTYYLSAEKEGKFTIPGVTVVSKNKQMKSNAVTIQVVKGSGQSQGQQRGGQSGRAQGQAPSGFNKNDVFVKAFCSKTNPYVGEQVTVTYKLYSPYDGYVNGATLPKQANLWAYDLESSNQRPTTEVINGKRYSVSEIKKTALFPQKSGEITITPMELDMTVRVVTRASSGDPFFDSFFGGMTQANDFNLDVKSNSIKLNVKPLPTENAPEEFSGVVGNFTINALLSRDKVRANDATNLTITVSGSGNIQYIDALNLNFPPDFDVSEPIITDKINKNSNTVTGSRIFEYTLIPRSAGKFTLDPITFSYFDLQSRSYKTIETESFDIEVEKGDESTITSVSSNQKDIKILDKDIRYIKTSKFNLKQNEKPFFNTPLYHLILALPLLLFIIILIIWRKRIEYMSNTELVKNKRALKVAKKSLTKAHKLLQENNKEEFYIEISRALWGYLSDKYHIALSQLSIDTVERRLTEKGIPEENIQEFVNTLNQCEFARFAPGDSSTLMQEMYEQALQSILKNESSK